MTQVKLVRRYGHRQPGETVELDKTEAEWLIGIGHAVRPGQEAAGTSTGTGRVHPGTDGPDPALGGDPSRLRMRSEVKSPRGGERAGRVQGAPRAAGDVTHVRDENLAGLNKKARNDVPLASGKLLTEELDEHQREIEKAEQKRKGEQGKREQGKREQETQGEGGEDKPAEAPKSEAKK